MFCGFGKKNRNNKNTAPVPMPAGMSIARKVPNGQANPAPEEHKATPIDLRAEKDEPIENTVILMDYL